MCLAIPAKIVAINGEEAVAEIQGVRRKIIVSLINEPRVGDYVLIHAGFAIRKWSEEDVREFNEIVGGEDIIGRSQKSVASNQNVEGKIKKTE